MADTVFEAGFLPAGTFLKHKAIDRLKIIELNDAIRDSSHQRGKKAYLKALSMVPELVLVESDPLLFLQRDDFDAKNAAKRLMKYWASRYEYFGEDAYKPMTLYEGALNEEDRKHVRAGHLVATNVTSMEENLVVVSDMSRIVDTDSSSQKARLRAVFYAHQVAVNWPRICEKDEYGMIVVVVMTWPKMDQISAHNALLSTTCFPYRIRRVHFVDALVDRKFSLFRTGFAMAIRTLYQKVLFTAGIKECHIHEARPLDEICAKLCGYDGLTKEKLPKSVGGTWDYSQFRSDEELNNQMERLRLTDLASRYEDADRKPAAISTTLSLSHSVEVALVKLPIDDHCRFLLARKHFAKSSWEKECPLDAFLSRENGDASLAAKRFAGYLKLRMNLFHNRQYERLTQAGEAALSERDIKVLKTGFLYPLPKDRQGRPVLWIDESCLGLLMKTSARNRCLFYMFSILSEHEAARTEGVVLLHKTIASTDSLAGNVEILEQIANCLPIRFHSVHRFFMDKRCSSDLQQTVGGLGAQWFHHTGPNFIPVVRRLLAAHDLTQAGLHASLGGDWDATQFALWQVLRTQFEQGKPFTLDKAMDNFPGLGDGFLTVNSEDKNQSSDGSGEAKSAMFPGLNTASV